MSTINSTTPTLTDDLANVLTLVQRVFVGQCDVRREIARVLDRYAEEQRENFEQVTAERLYISAEIRARCTADSLSREIINGIPVPF